MRIFVKYLLSIWYKSSVRYIEQYYNKILLLSFYGMKSLTYFLKFLNYIIEFIGLWSILVFKYIFNNYFLNNVFKIFLQLSGVMWKGVDIG